ncbi:glutaredoxin family protein [Halovibrio sp. HP20-50]|uniref:glutaredoxin family protein n=1 Tax=Halovibrio sp. HP20-59 TaxID=3080275 RepID=UPI00294B60C8|nr:glutaredoxin family protein [Halovibrio sp. HP20-59]MEA2118197.1 glutaredoxin family protein [Halovibrio sp. HP20-59]
MIQLSLYTTMGCHLCSQLEALVAALANQKVWLHHIEISDDDALVERYGVRIPVLADSDGSELDRGFELERLSAWLRERGWLDEAALEAFTAPPEITAPKGAHERDGRRFLS